MASVDKAQLAIAETRPWRVIPSLNDGLVPLQRKILHTLLLPKSQKEIKVVELTSKVTVLYTNDTDWRGIEQSIMKLARNFVGANNINYLEPNGNFGSRREGGEDGAEGRFVYTKLSTMARVILPAADESHLTYHVRKGKRGEPRTYQPALPMILVNGYEARGQDWQTYIPPYNSRDVIENLRRRIRGSSKNDMRPMQPWFRNWTGQVEKIDQTHYCLRGKMQKISGNVMEVTELPPCLWTQDFKSVLDDHTTGPSPTVKSYKELPAIQGVRFEIELDDSDMDPSLQDDLEAHLCVQVIIATNNMVALDAAGKVQKYATELDILEDFYLSRLQSYSWNKRVKIMAMKQDLTKWEDQSRFAKLLLGGKLDISQDRDTLLGDLIRHNFTLVENYDDVYIPTKKRKRDVDDKPTISGFEHLFEMTVASMMPGPMRKHDLMIVNKKAEMAELENRSIEEIWEADLQMIEEEWDRQVEYDRTHPQASNCKKCGGLGCSPPNELTSGRRSIPRRGLLDSFPSD
jgi:DNA topoisomerase-2